MIGRVCATLKSRFGVRMTWVLALLTVVLFASNPELLSFVFVVNALGVDIFLLFVSFQMRSYIEAAWRILVYPLLWRKAGKKPAESQGPTQPR